MKFFAYMLAALSIFLSPIQASESDSFLIGKTAPVIASGNWINTSKPLSLERLKGKVVLIEFWTFGCYNCRNTIPVLNQFYKKYAGTNFEIIGIHTPELPYERSFSALQKQVTQLDIRYPVVTDNDYNTWQKFGQHYWPTLYVIDRQGVIRYMSIGEGNYEEIENKIVGLLKIR